MPQVSILIPHHANRALLKPLFTSLTHMNYPAGKVELVLVDNNSTDGSIKFVKKAFPQVRIIEFDENLGFAPALNRAARQCESKWLCFLNNDVRVDPDWLANLMNAATNIDAQCFASRVLDWDGKNTTFAGGSVNWFGKGFEETELQKDTPYEIFFPCGCGTLIKRQLFLDIGGFDEDYFMLFEDVDLGWRLQVLGESVYLVSDACVMHKAHTSLDKLPYEKKAIYFERNSLANLYKNVENGTLAVLLPLALKEAHWRAQAIGGMGLPVRYSRDGLAITNAVNDFISKLPKWREKREWVQARRKRADHEIFKRFFHDPQRVWAFHDGHYQRLHYPEVHTAIKDLYTTAHRLLMNE